MSNFGEALKALKEGFKVARKGWNGNGMFAVMSPGHPGLASENLFSPPLKNYFEGFGSVCILPSFMLKTAQDDIAMWVPSCSDLLAEDWCILD